MNGLNKNLKFGRTVYIPYNRILMISGADADLGLTKPVSDVFEFDLLSNKVTKKRDINVARTSFAAHYEFEERYIYIVGGCNSSDQMIPDVERFDLFRETWEVLPSMNRARGNPGTIIT